MAVKPIQQTKVYDYIPCVSTFTGIKGVITNLMKDRLSSPSIEISEHSFKYLEERSLIRCCILLIPILGNILVAIYDFRKVKVLDQVRKNPNELAHLSDHWKKDREVVLTAVFAYGGAIQHVPAYQNDEEIVKIAIRNTPDAYPYINPQFREQKELTLSVVERLGSMLEYVPASLKNDEDVVSRALKKDPAASIFVEENLLDSLKASGRFIEQPIDDFVVDFVSGQQT